MDKCIYCNSQNIKTNIEVGQTAEAGAIGLVYRTKFVISGVEAFYADLCLDCGSIARLYVKNRDRNWCVKNKGESE
jgi:hypothetical protein